MKQLLLLQALYLCMTACNAQPATSRYEHRKKEAAPEKRAKLFRTQGTDAYANIQCGVEDAAGNLWFGTYGEGLYRYDGSTFIQFTTKEGLNSNKIWSAATDSSGNLWLGTDNGICRFDGQTFTAVPIMIGASPYMPFGVSENNDPSGQNEVWSIIKDKSGLLWFGTRAGLYCYDGRSFTRFLDRPGLRNKEQLRLTMVECLLEGKDGTIWIGSGMIPGNEGIVRYDPASGELSSFKPGGDGWIRYIMEDTKGHIWFGARKKGIWKYDGKIFSAFMQGNDIGLSGMVDKAGRIWFSGGEKDDGFSSDGGIWLCDGDTIRLFSTERLGGYSVWCMLQDRAGNIWFGTRNTGLYRYDGHTFTSFYE